MFSQDHLGPLGLPQTLSIKLNKLLDNYTQRLYPYDSQSSLSLRFMIYLKYSLAPNEYINLFMNTPTQILLTHLQTFFFQVINCCKSISKFNLKYYTVIIMYFLCLCVLGW